MEILRRDLKCTTPRLGQASLVASERRKAFMNTLPRATSKYAVGVDFGTESGRTVLVDVSTGRELASSVHIYANGVIDETLPGTTIALGADWALQDPNDYLEVFKTTIPAVLAESGVNPDDVIGIGLDFTSGAMLPPTVDRTPLCFLPEWRNHPHA